MLVNEGAPGPFSEVFNFSSTIELFGSGHFCKMSSGGILISSYLTLKT